MTTAACKDNVLAADSLLVFDDHQKYHAEKIITNIFGKRLVCAGDVSDCHRFVEQLRKGESPDATGVQYILVDVLCDPPKVYLGSGGWPGADVTGMPVAIGSGSLAARAAMELGHGAIHAVDIACIVDPYSEGPVTSEVLYDETRTNWTDEEIDGS